MLLDESVPTEVKPALAQADLPWWTWALPFFIANLGTWLSLWFQTGPGASLWYLPTAFGIVMAYWWGPRVLLGVYLNAVVCTPLWDLPWQWSFLYALPETLEVGFSWFLFIKMAGGKSWLPDLRNVGAFLLFGSLLPTLTANAYLVTQLYLLGNIAPDTVWDNWRILFSADLATQFVFAVPALVLFTRFMVAKGWTQTKDNIPRLPFLIGNRDSFVDIILVAAIFIAALISIILFSVPELWILYGLMMVFIAIRYGVNMAVLGTSWIGILTFLLPALLTGQPRSPSTYNDYLTTNLNILFLCGVTLITGRAISDLSSREKYLELLNDMTHAILLSKDIDSTLQTLAFDMAKLLNADDCYITGWNAVGEQTIPLVSTAKLEFPYPTINIPPTEISLTKSVLLAGHALAADDVFHSPFISPLIAQNYPARSLLGVPLIAGEQKLGAALIAFNTPHRFAPDEIERAEQAGAQVALALWNFRQGVEIQQRLKESNALAKISRALSETERVGTGEVLQLIVDSARELMPHAQKSVIHLLEREEQVLFARAVSGFDESEKEYRRVKMRLGQGVAGQVIREGVTINIGDVHANRRFLLSEALPAFRSLLVAPVQSGGQQIGTISVQSSETNAFSAKDSELLNALAIQAAIAIENTNLFETTQQRLKEVNILYQISRSLSASLDADQLISDVVGLLQQIFGYYHVQIYLIDPETGNHVIRHGSGYIGGKPVQQGHHLPAGEGIVGHVAETGEPFFTNNVDAVVFFKRNSLLPHTQSEIAVPIKVDKHVVGVLDIQTVPEQRLTDNDFQLMNAIADQMAVSLQKAQLYSELQTALQQEQAVRSQLIQSERLALVGRLLASVSHELNNPLQAIQNALFLLREETNLSSQAKQDLDIILSEAERMAALIERLRTAYGPVRSRDFRAVELNSLIEDVHALITTHMRHKEISFEFMPEEHLPCFSGIPDQIRQVVLNLFLNAIEVMKPGGRLIILTRSLPPQKEVLLTVKDTGPGIDSEILPRIFEPFITSKHTGTGLGLTITHDIIQQHHGRIEAQNDPQGGAIFNVWLPMDEGVQK